MMTMINLCFKYVFKQICLYSKLLLVANGSEFFIYKKRLWENFSSKLNFNRCIKYQRDNVPYS